MRKKSNRTFNYYFLNKRLHPNPPPGYRTDIILLIINKNPTANNNKYLFVQQNNKFWNLPKEGTKTILADDLFNTIARNLEEEIGFKGIKVIEDKPMFKQIALIFDFEKQEYDLNRSKDEKNKNRPVKGKIYHLAIMEFHGPENFSIKNKSKTDEIIDLKWVNKKDGEKLVSLNKNFLSERKTNSPYSASFNVKLFKKVINFYNNLTKIRSSNFINQGLLFE